MFGMARDDDFVFLGFPQTVFVMAPRCRASPSHWERRAGKVLTLLAFLLCALRRAWASTRKGHMRLIHTFWCRRETVYARMMAPVNCVILRAGFPRIH